MLNNRHTNEIRSVIEFKLNLQFWNQVFVHQYCTENCLMTGFVIIYTNECEKNKNKNYSKLCNSEIKLKIIGEPKMAGSERYVKMLNR